MGGGAGGKSTSSQVGQGSPAMGASPLGPGGQTPLPGGGGREMGSMAGPWADKMQAMGGQIPWEEIQARLGQGRQRFNPADARARMQQMMEQRQGQGGGQANPWGNAQANAMFDRGGFNPQGAITNPGSLAASQGAPTSSGITAPGAVTGAPATPQGGNPQAPTDAPPSGTIGTNNPSASPSRAQALIQALRR